MNNNNGREMKILVVAALIISIVAIGIGFAAFSETLTINGNASVQTSSWKVKFSDLGTAQNWNSCRSNCTNTKWYNNWNI